MHKNSISKKILHQELMQIVGISTGGIELQEIPGVSQLECFQVNMASVESFLLNLGSTYVIELIKMYKARNEADYKMLLERIANICSCIWFTDYIYWNHKEMKTILQEMDLVQLQCLFH
jgi:hypothetical protein